MALAMAAIVTGCNQNNELGTPAPSGEEDVWGIERSGFFNGREKWAKGFENQRV
jgi:hypothetical protein